MDMHKVSRAVNDIFVSQKRTNGDLKLLLLSKQKYT